MPVVVGSNTSSTEYCWTRALPSLGHFLTLAVTARDVIQLTRRGQESGTIVRLRDRKGKGWNRNKDMDVVRLALR